MTQDTTGRNGTTLTVADLAAAKKLPVEFLKGLGLGDSSGGVTIPYYDVSGTLLAVKRRTNRIAKKGSYWPKGKPLLAYGQQRLQEAHAVRYLVLVEGESDCWALWFHKQPALGLPGSDTVDATLTAELVECLDVIYVHQENDQGGERFVGNVRRRLAALEWTGQLRVLTMPAGLKDPADLHAANPQAFDAVFEEALKAAAPIAGPKPAANDEPRGPRRDAHPPPEINGRHKGADVKERTLADLVSLEDLEGLGTKLTWIWDGWILESALTLVSANAGVGKTRMIGDLVRRIRHGDNWPDGQPMTLARDTPIIWLPSDCQFGELAQIHKDFRLGKGVYLNSYRDDPLGGTSVDTNEDLGSLRERIGIAGAKLIIVDTLGNATDADLCRQEEAKRLATPLMRIAADLKVAILLLYHTNKEGKPLGRRMVERCRTCISLDRPDGAGDGVFNLAVDKSFGIKPPPLRGVMAGGGIDYFALDQAPPVAGASAASQAGTAGRPPQELQKAANWILQQLAQGRQRLSRLATVAADDHGIKERTFWRARDYLLRHGKIEQSDDSPKYAWLADQEHEERVSIPFVFTGSEEPE